MDDTDPHAPPIGRRRLLQAMALGTGATLAAGNGSAKAIAAAAPPPVTSEPVSLLRSAERFWRDHAETWLEDDADGALAGFVSKEVVVETTLRRMHERGFFRHAATPWLTPERHLISGADPMPFIRHHPSLPDLVAERSVSWRPSPSAQGRLSRSGRTAHVQAHLHHFHARFARRRETVLAAQTLTTCGLSVGDGRVALRFVGDQLSPQGELLAVEATRTKGPRITDLRVFLYPTTAIAT